jgi:hypothetical protein
MRRTLSALGCLLLVLVLVAAGVAQQKPRKQQNRKGTPAQAGVNMASTLEAKVTQAWDDYKNKRKDAFAANLTDDFIIVDESGLGPRDRQADLEDFDHFTLNQYVLRDITVKPIGPDSALVTYNAEYSGNIGRQPIHEKLAVGEIWVHRGGAWKCMYAQMTRMN